MTALLAAGGALYLFAVAFAVALVRVGSRPGPCSPFCSCSALFDLLED